MNYLYILYPKAVMWFLLSLSAGLLFAANRLFIRAIAKNHTPLDLVTIHNFLAGLFLLPLLFTDTQLPTKPRTWGLVAATTVFIFLADWSATKSLASIEASFYQIIGQLRHGFVLFGAVIFFGESFTLSLATAVTTLVIGVAIALLNRSQLHHSSGVKQAVWSTIFISIASLLIKEISDDISAVLLGIIVLFSSSVMAFTAIGFDFPSLRKIYLLDRKPLLTATFLFAVFEFCFFKAIEVGDISRVTPATQSSMVFTVIGGYLFLHERKYLFRKAIGASFITIAIAMIYLW